MVPGVGSLARRSVSTLVVGVLVGSAFGCGTDEEAGAGGCDAVRTVADSLGDLGASEGDTAGTAVRFDASAGAFDEAPAPARIQTEWVQAAEALRYYGEAARESAAGRGDQRTRSEADLQRWRAAFSRITAFGIDQCDMGWRTAFADCRRGSPPAASEQTRLVFPCAA